MLQYGAQRSVFIGVRKIAKSDYKLRPVCLTVLPFVRMEQLSFGRISGRFIFEYF